MNNMCPKCDKNMQPRPQISVVFMGTPDFACPTLARLYFDENIDLRLVVTKEDKPSGRGNEMRESDVKKLTKALNEFSKNICEHVLNEEKREGTKKDINVESGIISSNDNNVKKDKNYKNYFNALNSINDKKCREIIARTIVTMLGADRCGKIVSKVCQKYATPSPNFPVKIVSKMCQKYATPSPNFIVVVAYGKILPKEVLAIPTKGCINGHASLLPKYRGASPVQNCIKNGENETGVTTMLMNEGLDTGDILKIKKIKIEDEDTGGSLFEKLSYLTADCVLETLKDFDNITPIKQNEEDATYVKPIAKEDGLINPDKETKEQVLRKIRAYNPWPGTHLICDGHRIKINRAKSIDNDEIIKKIPKNEKLSTPPKFCIIDKKIVLPVLDGFLEVLELQPEGRRNMQAKDYINGLK